MRLHPTVAVTPLAVAALLAACTPPQSGPVPMPSPSLEGRPAPASPSTTPTPTVAPSVTPSTGMIPGAKVVGTVYDEAGNLMGAGTEVSFRSLNPSNPFETKVPVVNGRYEVGYAPAGVLVEVTAHREGWTSRTRTETFVPTTVSATGTTVDFGGASAPAYFLSNRPEVMVVEPAEGAKDVDPSKLVVKLTLSERLSVSSQRWFARAIRVFPANAAAAPGAASVANLNETPSFVTAFPETGHSNGFYTIREGTTHMGALDTAATVSWDVTGRVATLSFAAPLITDRSTAPAYQVALVSAGPGERIADEEGNPLGTSPEAGQLIQDAFKAPFLTGKDWAATHVNASRFELARDTQDPSLTAVSVLSTTSETRIALTFSEPMGAFFGKVPATAELGAYNASLALTTPTTNLGITPNGPSFTFAVAETTTMATAIQLDGKPEAGVDAQAAEAPINQEFGLQGANVRLSAENPRVIHLFGRAGLFPTKARALKVRVSGYTDPAGNAIETQDADPGAKVTAF